MKRSIFRNAARSRRKKLNYDDFMHRVADIDRGLCSCCGGRLSPAASEPGEQMYRCSRCGYEVGFFFSPSFPGKI